MEVSFAEDRIHLLAYDFPGATVHPTGILTAAQIRDADWKTAPQIRTRLGEPFLDTWFDPEDQLTTVNRLREAGLSDEEVVGIRQRRTPLMHACNFDSMLWEWVNLGEAGTMRKLIFGMNVTLDGYIAAPGDDIGWSGPSDELFQWWLDREQASGLSLYGRKLWETMSSYWPTGDEQPDATPAQIEFARNWRDTPKVVFSSTVDKVDWNTRLVTGDAVAEITRLKAEDGGPTGIGGATLAGAAMRAGLIDEYQLATYPVLVGGGTPFFTALDSWVNLDLVETRTFPGGVVLTRYETRR